MRLWPSRKPDLESSSAEELRKAGARELGKKRTDKAISLFEAALEKESASFEGRINLASAYYMSAQPDKAVPHLRYVLAIEQDHPTALLNLAACLSAMSDGKEREARIALAEEGDDVELEAEPGDLPAHVAELKAESRSLLDDSIECLEKLLASRPNWKDGHYNLAAAYMRRGDKAKAETALKRELELNPHHNAARDLLNRVYITTAASPDEGAKEPPTDD